MSKEKISLLSILSICGACISFYIGAGFATMQEVVQYEASYGSYFPIVILVTAVIYLYTNFSLATNRNRLQLQRGGGYIHGILQLYGRTVWKVCKYLF